MANPNDDSLGSDATRLGGSKPEELDGLSLGDQATLGGGMLHDTARSLGDLDTFGGGADVQSDDLGDEMEVVDLSSRYTIERVLGKGGMGEVLLAYDNRLKRKVAIKRVLGEMARSKTAVRRFLTEAQSVAALNHFNIVQIYDYGRDKDGPFLIMEYVDGSSLLDRCHNGAIPLEEVIDITCQLCDGLSRAHELGIIHRDIKPANILLTKDGKPKLTDFGLAKQSATDLGETIAGAFLGTLDFMPPEQRRDAALTDARSDLWSLAASLYQMVTGKSPKIIRFDLLPASLTSVLGKALEENKEDRYQTAAEFRAALQTVLQPVDAGEVELIAGQCPSCSAKNEAGRKFCRKCAASLEVPCLSCKKGIQLWDEVCGQCGVRQGPLLEKGKAEMHEQQQHAESLRQDFQFKQAIQIATSLRDAPDLRLQQLKGWGDRFLTDIQEDIQDQLQRSQTLVTEALAHETAYDDNAGIKAIEKIPVPLRGEMLRVAGKSISPNQLLTRLKQRETKVSQLEKAIQSRLKVRDLNGLLPQIEELRTYRPNRSDIVRLKQELEERLREQISVRDMTLSIVRVLLKTNKYDQALAALNRIDPSVATSEMIELRKMVEQKNNQVLYLRKEIQKGVNKKQYDSLLEPVEALLTLVGTDEAMLKLRDQLHTRYEKLQAEVDQTLSEANALREQCQFRSAAETLAKIPATRVTKDVRFLINDCESLADHRDSTLRIMRRAIAEKCYTEGYQAFLKYSKALDSSGLQDPEFNQLYQQCKNAVAEQKATAEAAEHLQASLRKTVFVVSRVGAGIVILAVGFWIYSSVRWSMRDKAIADGIATQQWKDVLAWEPKNVRALLGRAGVRINQTQPDIEGAFKDLETAESINSLATGLKELKATAYAKRSESNANAGKISEAESNLQAAQKLNAAEAIIAETKKAIGQAYLKRAYMSAADKQIAAALSDDDYERAILDLTAASALGVNESEIRKLKATLVTTFMDRFRKSMTNQDYERAGIDFAIVSQLDASVVDKIKDAFNGLPSEVLTKFFPSVNSLGMAFKLIPSGKFRMGESRESHDVTITRPYYLGVFEVTQEQYQRVTGKNRSYFKHAKYPVEQVSWDDAVLFCQKLSELPAEKSAGRVYRLPTEAEWEHACRAGSSTAYSFGDAESQLHDYAWCGNNSGEITHAVGLKKPNAFGLYDMHGNVWEWCQDWYGDYPSGGLIDPRGPSGGSDRVLRGGSWSDGAGDCRAAYRRAAAPANRRPAAPANRPLLLGFRIALSPP